MIKSYFNIRLEVKLLISFLFNLAILNLILFGIKLSLSLETFKKILLEIIHFANGFHDW